MNWGKSLVPSIREQQEKAEQAKQEQQSQIQEIERMQGSIDAKVFLSNQSAVDLTPYIMLHDQPRAALNAQLGITYHNMIRAINILASKGYRVVSFAVDHNTATALLELEQARQV
jgi:hypothetical protein